MTINIRDSDVLRGLRNRYRYLRRRDVSALGWNVASTGSAAVLAVLEFGDAANLLHWALGGTIVLGSTVNLAESAVHRTAEEREKRRRLARSLIEDLYRGVIPQMSSCPDKTGGVIFLPDEHGVLRTAFTYNKKGRPDNNLSFRPLEGCTGHAWDTKAQTYADLEKTTPSQLQETWKLSPEYVTLTQHLKAVVSTPIASADDPNQYIGIVSIDSEVSASECGLLSDASLDVALQFAASVACILSLADLM